jgi:hypothetical protein
MRKTPSLEAFVKSRRGGRESVKRPAFEPRWRNRHYVEDLARAGRESRRPRKHSVAHSSGKAPRAAGQHLGDKERIAASDEKEIPRVGAGRLTRQPCDRLFCEGGSESRRVNLVGRSPSTNQSGWPVRTSSSR